MVINLNLHKIGVCVFTIDKIILSEYNAPVDLHVAPGKFFLLCSPPYSASLFLSFTVPITIGDFIVIHSRPNHMHHIGRLTSRK